MLVSVRVMPLCCCSDNTMLLHVLLLLPALRASPCVRYRGQHSHQQRVANQVCKTDNALTTPVTQTHHLPSTHLLATRKPARGAIWVVQRSCARKPRSSALSLHIQRSTIHATNLSSNTRKQVARDGLKAEPHQEPVSQYRLRVVGAEGVAAATGLSSDDLAGGRLVLAVECWSSGERLNSMAAVLREEPLTKMAIEEGGPRPTVQVPTELDIPAAINSGADLFENKIMYKLDKKGRLHLDDDEALLYHYSNEKLDRDPTTNCIVLTNKRIVKIHKGATESEAWLADIAEVVHVENSSIRWDKIQLLTRDGKAVSIGVFSSKATAFFVHVVDQIISPLARAELAHLRQFKGAQNDPLVAETLQAWSQDMSWFVADWKRPSLVVRLLHYPPPVIDVNAKGDAGTRLPCEPVVLAESKHFGIDTVDKGEVAAAAADGRVDASSWSDSNKSNVQSKKDGTGRRWVELFHTTPGQPAVYVALNLRRFAALEPTERPVTAVAMRLPRVGVSIVNEHPQELLYLSLHSTTVEITDCFDQQTLEFIMGRIQMDNQQYGARFPVILAPTPVEVEERHPMMHLSLNKTKDDDVPVQIFSYASFLMQAIDIKVDESLLYELQAFASGFRSASSAVVAGEHGDVRGKAADVKRMSKDVDECVRPPGEATSTEFFFKLLHIQSMRVNLWFIPQPGMRQGVAVFPISLLLGLAGSTLGSIENAAVRLKSLMIRDASGDANSLVQPIVAHYKDQVMWALLPILGSFEFMGNPVSLVGSLGSGVKDFFYEPMAGIVESPQAFGKGLKKGSTSLLTNTFEGVFGAISNVTSSVNRGKAASVVY